MNIGVLGGTFNPIHNGHIHIAEAACREIPLDRLIWVPTAVPPFKTEQNLIDVKFRYEMVQLAIQGHPNWEVSDLELDPTRTSYTVETLDKLSQRFPFTHRLYLIIGSDNLAHFPDWKDAAKILKLAEVVALTRPGFSLRIARGPMRLVPIPPMDVSASNIRKLLQREESVKTMVPDAVLEYIEKKRLYVV